MLNITSTKYYELDFDKTLEQKGLYFTEWFFTNLILKSRIELGLPSNEDFFDEDVNVYLAGLLKKFVSEGLPNFKYDIDIYEKLFNKKDKRLQYEISKTYADLIFAKSSVFPNFNESPTKYTYKCSTWYDNAATLGSQVAVKKALIEILEKIAADTDKYLFIVDNARKEYLNMRVHFSDFHLQTLVNQGKNDYESKETN